MALSNWLRGSKRKPFFAITLISVCLIIFINLPEPEQPPGTSQNLSNISEPEQIQNKITDAPAIDNMYLEPPSQQWIREQFDKAYTLLGYEKSDQRSWMTCSNLKQQYYFKNIETVFTAVPKSGNSNWIYALLLADGGIAKPLDATNINKVHGALSYKVRLIGSHGWINKMGSKWIDSATREAFSFAVVRNPWTRMVSGYKDKIAEYDEPGTFKGTLLTKNLRISVVEEIRGVYDETLYPTFEEFLLYLIRHETTSNIHFIPQYQLLCIPQASYDYVIPLEYSNVMHKDLWNHINTSVPLLDSYDSVSDPRQQSSALRAKDWFSKIKPEIIEQLYDLYRADFVLMNYSNFSDPNFPLPLHYPEL